MGGNETFLYGALRIGQGGALGGYTTSLVSSHGGALDCSDRRRADRNG